FDAEKFIGLAERLGITHDTNLTQVTLYVAWVSSLLISLLLTIFFWKKANGDSAWTLNNTWWMLMVYLGWFIFLSGFLTGAHWGYSSLRDILYWLNALLILFLGRMILFPTAISRLPLLQPTQFVQLSAASLLLLLVLSWVLVQSHGELPGAQIRFSVWK
ncbi:MAG: hypothetical protein AAF223_17620, partial [Bacteroidota bacterium]